MRSHSRSLTYELMDRAVRRLAGPFKRAGARLYRAGVALQGEYGSTEAPRADPRTVAVGAAAPEFSKAKFVAPNATLAGDVRVGEDAAVYYASQLHAFPGSRVVVGRGAIVQDLALLKATDGQSTEVGDLALCAPNCYVCNSRVGPLAFIGAGARLMDAEVAEGGVLAAGAVLVGGRVGPEEVWAGNPAAFLRRVTAEERDHLNDLRQDYAKLHCVLAEEEAKDGLELELDRVVDEHLQASPDQREAYYSSAIQEQNHVPDEEDHEDPRERERFIEWANFVKRFPEKQLMQVDSLHADFPEHLNVHNPNFKFAQKLEESLRTEKQTPDTSLIDARSFSHEAKTDGKAPN